MNAALAASAARRSQTRPADAQAGVLRRRFPPRPALDAWPRTSLPRADLEELLAGEPFTAPGRAGERNRHRGAGVVLDWLQAQPGTTWQQRWLASGAGLNGRADWRAFPARWLAASRPPAPGLEYKVISAGLLSLICADVIRPAPGWLLITATPVRLAAAMARTRDPAGFTRLTACCEASPVSETTTALAFHRIAAIMAAKGGVAADITIGDCLQFLDEAAACCAAHHIDRRYESPYFYKLLHAAGMLGPGAAPSVRALPAGRQLNVEQLVGRCAIECLPVRDLLTDYLHERQASLDYVTLARMADTLGRLFWADLEAHHPGISSLRLDPAVAAAWKQRIFTKTTRHRQPDGSFTDVVSYRESATTCLTTVRSFYLDIAQWAMEDPARWAHWAAPCPVKAGEIPHKRTARRRKSRMDQRTRERLPILPALATATDNQRRAAAERLAAATATPAGQVFTAGGQTLWRAVTARSRVTSVWAENPGGGPRRNLTREEQHAFWAWAAAEVLRMTGIRIEELTELTHHSLIQYRLPATGELIPLLHILPSKTDTERLLVVSPELADVLSAIIYRIRDLTGAVPLAVSYDYYERVYRPPLPILFQARAGIENRQLNPQAIRRLLNTALAATQLTDTTGQPLRLSPHDFRRIFITDAVMNGMPTSTPLWATKPSTPTKPSTATGPSSPAAAPCAPARNTAPPPTPNGTTSSATSSAAKSPSETAPAPTGPPASTSTAASAALCYGPTQPSGPGWPASAPTCRPASKKPTAKAGSAKPKDSRSASPPQTANSPNSTTWPAAAPPSTSACQPSPPSPRAPSPPRATPQHDLRDNARQFSLHLAADLAAQASAPDLAM
jgi:hypothetical protein